MLNWLSKWLKWFPKCGVCDITIYRKRDKVVFLAMNKENKSQLYEMQICKHCADIINAVQDTKKVNSGSK